MSNKSHEDGFRIRISIFHRIVTYVVILIFLGVMTHTYLAVRSETRLLTDGLIRSGTNMASTVALSTQSAFWSMNWLYVENILQELKKTNSKEIIHIRLLKPDGEIYLADDKTRYGEKADHSLLFDRETIVDDYFFSETGEQGYLLVRPFEIDNDRWYVHLGLSQGPVKTAITGLIIRETVIAGIIMLLGIAASFFLFRAISGPIISLADSANIIAGGDLDHRVTVKSKDEVGFLSYSFNRMTERLKQTTASIDDLNREINERKKAEDKLRESEERYRNLVENMSEIIYTVDGKGIVTYVSPVVEQVTGYKTEEITGRNLIEFLHPEDVPHIADDFRKIMSGSTEPAEYRLLIKSGDVRWVKTMIRPIYKNDRIVEVQGILSDITNIKKAEEEIKSHQEHLELINKILRHDLTNDLSVIRSAINLYKDSPEEALLKEISAHTEKSLKLIERMRKLESFISRHSELKLCEMRDVIGEVIENYPAVDFEIKGKSQVMADDSLAPVIDNLIRNAIVHGKADRITINISKERDMCAVRIADNGGGLPDEIKEQIFKKGFAYGDTGHTGLGLHIVEQAMMSYGGYVYVEDNKPRGVVFVLMFVIVQ